MNARLDLLSSSPDVSATLARSFICCPRYSPAHDAGPEVLGLLVDATEHGVKRLVLALPALLSRTTYARQ